MNVVKFLKYCVGSLIISFGVLLVIAIIMRGIGIQIPDEVSRYSLLIWVSLAVLILPWAKKIIRVE